MAKNKSNLWIYVGIGILAIVVIGVFLVLFNNQNVTKMDTNLNSTELTNEEVTNPVKLSKNCVEDGCPNFYECKLVDAKNRCVKQNKEDTKEYKQFLIADLQFSTASDMTEVNYDILKLKLADMNNNITKLSSEYDVLIEQKWIQFNSDRTDFRIIVNPLMAELYTIPSSNLAKIAEKIIEINSILNIELARLNSYSLDDKQLFKEKFDYDVDERIVWAQSAISEYAKLLEKAEKGYDITLDIVDYDTRCTTYSDYCSLNFIKLKITSGDGIDILDPYFDIYIRDGDEVICREVDQTDYTLDGILANNAYEVKFSSVCYSDADFEDREYAIEIRIKEGYVTDYIAKVTDKIRFN
ncbi:MAG: hypothetical protein WC996_02225 [Peptostreptococcales bacterium]|nr:hypothetical protein [Candidatus ainarchaeum sp.]